MVLHSCSLWQFNLCKKKLFCFKEILVKQNHKKVYVKRCKLFTIQGFFNDNKILSHVSMHASIFQSSFIKSRSISSRDNTLYEKKTGSPSDFLLNFYIIIWICKWFSTPYKVFIISIFILS